MFTPIRNLITYIQRNASGSTFFGGTSSSTELSETTTTLTTTTTNTTNPTTMESEMTETNNINCTLPATATTELQSTSSSLKDQNLNEITNHHLHHQHHQHHHLPHHSTADNKLYQETKSFISTNPIYLSNPSVTKHRNYNEDDYLAENDEDEEEREEEEEEKDIFLDFPTENGENDIDFPVSEVVVLNDPDLNVSMNSDPAADPLAIDDYNVNLDANSPVNPLDSSTESNVLFVVDIEDVVGQAPRLIDEIEDTRQQLTSTVDNKNTDEQELRSDGSDSGLGSETSTLQTTTTDTSVGSIICASPLVEKIPLRSNLKRHHQDVVVDGNNGQQLQKKLRRSINFEGVKVFYFPRIQGHGCVPSQGGCTLGMGAHHISFKTFSLAEHAAELRRAHKLQLQEINPRGSSSEESDSDEELSEGSGSDLDAETNGFLQPVSPKQRRALLKAAGIRKIDPSEKIECRDIRNSREVCGCVCRDFCDPDTCACSQAGIKCQVDRAMFPCGCSRDACGNVIGRIEFNPGRVRTHFIHTIMRLDMENRQQKRSDELSTQLATSSSVSSSSSSPSLSSSSTHLGYNNISVLANSTGNNSISSTPITPYNQMPSYNSLDQSSSSDVYHHHQMQHQQYNIYNSSTNNMSQTHPATAATDSLCVQLSPSMVVMGSEGGTPSTHNLYANATATNITTDTTAGSENLSLNGGNLHYQDGSMYSAAIPTPVVSYGDMLTSYANTTPYDATNGTYSSTNIYNSYHGSHHNHDTNHIQEQQQHPFLGYATSCNNDIPDFNDNSHNNFISLNTPDASSARLSAINDLLDNTRNSTAALVAVSPEETPSNSSNNNMLTCEIESQPVSTNVNENNERKTIEQNPDFSIRPETPPADDETNVVQEQELPRKHNENLLEIPKSFVEIYENKEQNNDDNFVEKLKPSEPVPKLEKNGIHNNTTIETTPPT